MSLSRVVMRLARNPGTEFAGGDDHRGYALTVPLTADGHIDAAAYAKHKDACHVRRFAPAVLRHRIFRNFAAASEGIGSERVVAMLLDHVKEPDYK